MTHRKYATAGCQVSTIIYICKSASADIANPWGMSFGLNTHFWISDQVTNVSTLYSFAERRKRS